MGVVIEPNIGEHGTVFVTGRDAGANAIPTIILASEHYNLIVRLLQQNIPVKLVVEVQGRYDDSDAKTANVIAEIPGTDNVIKDEIVMVGAHLDSWHTGTGATDNADGVVTAMESLRILKALGVRPRRTIRIGLWAGEEQGLLGSRAYVEEHLAGDKNRAARDKFSVYFNLDNGYPPISGFYMEGNDPARKIMEEWMKPLANLGVIIPSPGHIGATDHLSFLNVGLPGFQAVQEYVNYDVRTHHTNVDFAERVDPAALKQASVVMASILYHASMREGKFPRPEPPKPATTAKPTGDSR
ncbi:MAG: M20/M25/M40 family metallo-hydrolase [Vicinamibacterales bacterium]